MRFLRLIIALIAVLVAIGLVSKGIWSDHAIKKSLVAYEEASDDTAEGDDYEYSEFA